jgi:hypothetical protein
MMTKALDILRNPLKFNFFLLTQLPIGWLVGLSMEHIDDTRAVVSIRYKYITQNPFRSIYFACLAMAGELASGALGLVQVYGSQPEVSMLVVKMEADFTKKAVGKILFTCADGAAIREAVEDSKRTGEGRTVVATSIGTDATGVQVAIFRITWSFKAKTIMAPVA